MRPESIAGAFDLNDDGVMQQPIQQSGGDHGVAEHVSPFGKASIGGENHGTFFVASTDQLKEQIGAFPGQWQVADLIDDEQRSAGIESKFGWLVVRRDGPATRNRPGRPGCIGRRFCRI